MVSVELTTVFVSSAFQLTRLVASETTTWLITGPVLVVNVMLNVLLLVEVTPAVSVAVIAYVCDPTVSEPSGAEKLTPPDDELNGPATPDTVAPSICSVEVATLFGPETFQVILPVACETTTSAMIGPDVLMLNDPVLLAVLLATSVAVI